MPDISTLELIAGLSIVAVNSTAILGAGTISIITLINALETQQTRKRAYEDRQEGHKTELNVLEKPKFRKAFADSCKFSYNYVRSLGKINTSNYDFDADYR
jgi:hypothetical protein